MRAEVAMEDSEEATAVVEEAVKVDLALAPPQSVALGSSTSPTFVPPCYPLMLM